MNQFQTLFALINDEIKAGTTNARNSATDALLWLKRYGFFFHMEIYRTFDFFAERLNLYQVFYMNSVRVIKHLQML
jgi:hypothetical protein